ncbi:hypothetical protein NDU88_007016 [Pleurodeles waltl]|uniref:Uncharacterized protein n=1 Tax=Pleurodeles waltl TaxID=8319 RepID=A0AAV7SRA9_PLEWA|nr:hypothetical protein NDU88_007016 [Pleurodeles waltl]
MPYIGCHSPVPGHSARMMLHHSSGVLPLLKELRAENVNFVVGSLDGSSLKMEYLKTYLSDTLFALSNRIYAMFNIISFSNEITKWCNTSVRISPENVAEAVSWIKTLPSDNGVDIQSALAEAFQDPACQAVVLITDSLPDHMLSDICDHASRIGKGRPLHILHLSSGNSSEDRRSNLVGAFQMVSLQPADNSCEVSACQPSCSAQHYSHPERHRCATHPMVLPEAHIPPCGLPINHNAPLADALMKRDFLNVSTETLRLLRGARVMARRMIDGYYYLGHIAQEVEGSGGSFLVEFEKCQKQKGKAQLRMQETALYDIIHYEDARRQPIVPGDRVLAPLDVHGQCYGPGKVLQGVECRGFSSDAQSSGVLVTFWNGHTRQVPPGVAVKIPLPLSDRIILELQMPPSARQKLVECSPGYPCSVPPGYRSSGGCSQPVCAHDAPWTQPCGTLSPAQSCHVSSAVWPGWSNEPDPVPGSSLKADKANRRNAEGVSMEKESLPGSSIRKEKKKKKKQRVKSSREHLAENYLKMSQDLREIRSILTSNAVNSMDAMPQRKGGLSPAHGSPGKQSTDVPEDYLLLSDPELSEVSNLQAVLKQIDLSLKKDRLLMESALPERRPHSAPNPQRIIWNSRKPDEQKRRIMEAKMEEWKRQEEEKQLQKEQELEIREQLLQQWELEIREKLQRQKLPQTSQKFDRQDHGHETTFQPMKLDGAMKVFRCMQKDVNEQEDEERGIGSPGHKVQYLKTRQNLRDELDAQYNQKSNVSAEQTKKETLRERRQSNRSHSVPKELDRKQSVNHFSRSSASRGSVRFSQQMEPENEMPRSRRQSPEHRSETKEGGEEHNLHHFSPHKAMKGSLRFSKDLEQASDSQRGRQQGPQQKFQSKLNERESKQDMFHVANAKTTQESGHAPQKTEQDTNRRQSPQNRFQVKDLSREQNLRPSPPQKATRGNLQFPQEVEQDIEMLRDRRWSPHHQFQNESQDLGRNQSLHEPSKSKATQGLGKMSQEMELASEMLKSRKQSPQHRFESERQVTDRERSLLSSSKMKTLEGSKHMPQEMKQEMQRSQKESPQQRFKSESHLPDGDQSLHALSKRKPTPGSKDVSQQMEQSSEKVRNRVQSSQKKFHSKPLELDREQNVRHSAYHTPTRGSKHVPHGSKPGSERDPGRSWQRDGHDPSWPYSMLA